MSRCEGGAPNATNRRESAARDRELQPDHTALARSARAWLGVGLLQRGHSDNSQTAMNADLAELELLAEQIRYHERAYREGAPELPDAAFDDLVDRYSNLADRLGVPASERLDARPGA